MRRTNCSVHSGLRLGAAALAAVLGACLVSSLAGCSAGPLIDRVPTEMGGLPSGAPKRTAAPGEYPAVHDMPPTRSTEPLNTEEQVKLEAELSQQRKALEQLQDKNAREKGEAANVTSTAAKEKARAAAETMRKKPRQAAPPAPAGSAR